MNIDETETITHWAPIEPGEKKKLFWVTRTSTYQCIASSANQAVAHVQTTESEPEDPGRHDWEVDEAEFPRKMMVRPWGPLLREAWRFLQKSGGYADLLKVTEHGAMHGAPTNSVWARADDIMLRVSGPSEWTMQAQAKSPFAGWLPFLPALTAHGQIVESQWKAYGSCTEKGLVGTIVPHVGLSFLRREDFDLVDALAAKWTVLAPGTIHQVAATHRFYALAHDSKDQVIAWLPLLPQAMVHVDGKECLPEPSQALFQRQRQERRKEALRLVLTEYVKEDERGLLASLGLLGAL